MSVDMCTSSSASSAHSAWPDHEHGSAQRRRQAKSNTGPGLGPKRGLSKYYSSKSQSFSSLELALSTQFGESALGLAKRPSSQDLVQAMHHALSSASGALEQRAPLSSLTHRANSLDIRSCALHQSRTIGGPCLQESCSLGGALTHACSSVSEVATAAPCCASPAAADGCQSMCDICLPTWLHSTTEELCAALHNASLSPVCAHSSAPSSQSAFSGPFLGTGSWAAAAAVSDTQMQSPGARARRG